MTTYNNKPEQIDGYVTVRAHDQNWGVIIGVGIVMLCMLVMVINLFVYEPKPDTAPNIVFWLRIGRSVALVGSLVIGIWLLWRLLQRRQAVEQTFLESTLLQAVNYTLQIEDILKAGSNGREQQLLTQIHTWQQTIETMAETLAHLSQNDHIIHDDLSQLPGVIADLEQQLSIESNPLLRTDLEQMLVQRQNQRLALEQLQTTRRRAEIQIERTISVLGTIYSQLLTYRSTFHVVDYQHLADNVAEEVQHLQDYLEALQEVKGSRTG